MVLPHPSGGNGRIAMPQPDEHVRLVLAGDQPEHASRPIENWIGQRHPPSALVRFGQRHISVPDVEHRIARHQRSGVPVQTQTEVDEIEDRRRSCDVDEGLRIPHGRLIEVDRISAAPD